MAADLDSPAITGTAVIEHKLRQIGLLLHRMRVVLSGNRGRVIAGDTVDALDAGLDAVRIDIAAIRADTVEQLRLGAEALEAANRVLKTLGAEGRVKAREPEPARFEGCYVPEPERPEYRKDSVVSTPRSGSATNVVILANVRRSRPEGGAR